ncbi:MAG: protein kinase [Gammaproteobacteria bacterium]|nr:protein kinase [Gammaproteobacteria bacterium]
MKDGDADKTRIQKSTDRETKPLDATRIAATKPTPNPGADKTRVAPSKQGLDHNKTRLKSNKSGGVSSDSTVYRPATAANPDKTRVAPPNKLHHPDSEKLPDQQEPGAAGTEHMLKDRFMLEEVLGVGGMGVVYKAKDMLKVEALDRDPYVAIKVLSEEFKTHPEAFISLQRESRKSQRIAHANIVNVYDFDRDGDTVFMTMEYLDGDPLDELIARYSATGLPTDDAWEVIRGMADALIHAHAERIIHSDFKPGNVFVTRKGLAKVFDFGIARAVAQVEHLEDNPNDKTLFDAGNLGALTPAYASLEMLESEEPDTRDDIYALGCVAYEMLTGEHPYNKVPADEAERQGMKPKRIAHIKKSQWRAIEKAISFRREDRLESVKEFKTKISPKVRSSSWLGTGLAIAFAAAITSYFLFFKEEPVLPEFSEFDIRNELELKIKIDFLKEDIELLLKDAGFTDVWQDSIWKGISDLVILTKGEDAWVDERTAMIYELYLKEIETNLKSRRFSKAGILIENARRYTDDESMLSKLSKSLASAKKQALARKKALAKQQSENAKKKQDELAERGKQEKLKQLKQQQLSEQESLNQQFNTAIDNLNNQLKCQANLNMRNFEIAINKLKQINLEKYQSLEKRIIGSLANCIEQIGSSFPERARAAQKQSLKIFDSTLLSSIVIKSRDPCDASIAGLGARGKRAICKDTLKSGSSGPDMVVIPASSKIASFAIGKYEVSVSELNKFCKASSSCSQYKQDSTKPIIEITVKLANDYLKWLSRQSGKKYRLPTKREWVHAARSRSVTLDPNRNCALSTRGFEKGSNLVRFSIGKQNSWGLVNHVGNVQEWVYASGRRLEAVGGSFREPMESCTITTSKTHDGNADGHTGFRILREIEG